MPEQTDSQPSEDQAAGWDKIDTLGIVAAVLLLAIVADILTDGKVISRRLRGKPQAPAEPEAPGE